MWINYVSEVWASHFASNAISLNGLWPLEAGTSNHNNYSLPPTHACPWGVCLNGHRCNSKKQQTFRSFSFKKMLDTCDVFTKYNIFVWNKQTAAFSQSNFLKPFQWATGTRTIHQQRKKKVTRCYKSYFTATNHVDKDNFSVKIF